MVSQQVGNRVEWCRRPGRGRHAVRDPAAADRWTRLIIACYPQLRLASAAPVNRTRVVVSLTPHDNKHLIGRLYP
jgi:hypothetical protein